MDDASAAGPVGALGGEGHHIAGVLAREGSVEVIQDVCQPAALC